MTTSEPLGAPVTVKVSHDNSGERNYQDWFLSKVAIVDIVNKKW
jgi:hypothetical protein